MQGFTWISPAVAWGAGFRLLWFATGGKQNSHRPNWTSASLSKGAILKRKQKNMHIKDWAKWKHYSSQISLSSSPSIYPKISQHLTVTSKTLHQFQLIFDHVNSWPERKEARKFICNLLWHLSLSLCI